MSFVKRNYIGGKTVITAKNLNDIQDAIIQIVPDDVKQALLQIASKVAYIDEHGQDYYDALEAALYPDASLVSISAVYTQSGTVYDTDSLDSLKADLVVTATYDDSTTATVTTYTLSGTLEVGTSTITVSYGGKTTTFNVAVAASPLPAEYRVVPYVAKLDTSAVLVNTGVTPTKTGSLQVEIGFMPTAFYNAVNYFLAGDSGTTTGVTVGFGVKCSSGGTNVGAYNGIDVNVYPNNGESILNKYIEATATFTSSSASIEVGELTDSGTGKGRQHNQPICLFGVKRPSNNNVEYPARGRIYYARVTNDGTLILDIIPCVRKSDDAAGFYDLVNDNFITANGLTAGE